MYRYITVDEENNGQLFYYFIKSERRPEEDPLVTWISGGPGCSSFFGLAFEIGPLHFDIKKYDGEIPNLVLHPYSWTKVSNILFIDIPIGAGFSFARRSEPYMGGDITSSKQVYKFIRKWLDEHPQFLLNPLYIGGDSYSGKLIPVITNEVIEGKFYSLQQGMTKSWEYCTSYLPYVMDIPSSLPYLFNISTRGYRALLYSGDHDMVVTHLAVQEALTHLNSSIVDDWRPWSVDGQVAGFTRSYANNLTFALGGGHTTPENRPEECYAMFERWISHKPL
ncbi:Serine carboxypeptidase-like 7 [Acorus gramineus]|uniref:Serine carboxypeptidase-like 7 n=1 Tax=Acorus gramineus TaxID=55184 RepID=A0AAV9AMG0_ACOGR|nr:Serine carboxypeptidase-like 7 [Acorus gramineus]